MAKRVFSGGKWIAELEGRFRGASAEALAGTHVIGTFAIFLGGLVAARELLGASKHKLILVGCR